MSKDIRSFFQIKKPAAQPKKPVIEDDDDVIPESPDVQIKYKKKESRKRVIVDDSDDEIFSDKKKKPSPTKNDSSKQKKSKTSDKPALKEVKVTDMFGGPIKRTEPLVKKVKKKTETGIHSDEEFEKSLLEVDINEKIDFKNASESVIQLVETKTIVVDKSPDKGVKLKYSSKDTIKKINSEHCTSHSNKEHEGSSKVKKNEDTRKEKSPSKDKRDRKCPAEKVTSEASTSQSTKDTKSESKKDKSHKNDVTKKERSKDTHHSDSKKEVKDESHLNSHSKPKRHDKDPNREQELNNKVNGEASSVKNENDEKIHKHGDHKSKHNNHNHEKETKKTPIKESKSEKQLNTTKNSSNGLEKNHKTVKSPVKVKSSLINGKNEKKRDFSEFLEDSIVDLDETVEDDKPKIKKTKMDKSLNESALTDEERFERKRYSAALYQNYLNRSGPKNLGAKEIPEGTPNCLANCAFLLTGVLDSFEREEIANAINNYGGCVKNSISKKVTHVLAGDDAGPAKMAKAQELGIPIIGEDDFIKIILENSGKSSKTSDKLKVKREIEKKSPKDKLDKKEKDKKSPKDNQDKDKITKESSKEIIKVKHEIKSKSCSAIKEEVTKKVIKIEDDAKSKSSSLIDSVAPLMNQESSKESIVGVGAPNTLMWVDKYKPQTIKQIIGQHGDASNVKKLMNWLTKWYVNRKTKLPKPSPWAKGDDGGYFKAVLLSGPPGVGKTTTVGLVCKELGFDAVEFNASDTRNKNLIREQIGELLSTNSLSGYARGVTGKQAVTKKHVLIMDEVDGMAGNEDRGGMQELINLIKSTSVPIICMCNDRSSQKMRSLVNYCYELRFNRPRVEQIKSAMLSICCKEGIKIPADALTQLIVAANQDVRQTLNLLSLWAVDSNLTDSERLKKDAKGVKKDIKLGPWEAVRKVFSEEDHKTMSIHDKSDLFFYDYSMAPLFVQENYLQVSPHCPKNEVLDRLSQAADSISAGDLVDARIRRNQAWSLLPTQAMYASVIPGHVLSGHVSGQIQFPGWLGKNSRATKMHRLCQEIHAHTRLSTSGSKSSIYLDYSTHLRDAVLNPLLKDKTDGIDRSLEVLESYHLLREDLDSLLELSLWPGQRNPMILIDSKVKAAMTRAYNKKAPALPYAPGNIKKSRGQNTDSENPEEYNEEEEEQEPDSDPENDALIKKKKVKEEKPSSSKGKEKASTSKEKPSTSKSKKK